MNSLTPKKKSLFLLLCTSLLCILLTACGKQSDLKEGICKCNISFIDIPQEFYLLEENLSEHFDIELTLQNTTNDNLYHIPLTQENEYSTQISLHPGTYKVLSVSNTMQYYNGITLTPSVQSITLSPDIIGEIKLTISDPAMLTKHWMEAQPMPEILLADKFSGLIQINRKIINIADILPELSLSHDSSIAAHDKVTLSDLDRGINVTLLNDSEQQKSWSDCRVIGVTVLKNSMVFPKGVTLGMTPSKVLHKLDGLYGEPNSFTGAPFYHLDYDHVSAIYEDSSSGNRIIVTLNPDSTYIQSISYEFTRFE